MDMVITPIALWLNTFFAGFDEAVTLMVHRLYELAGAFFSPLMEFISFLGHEGICLIIISIVLMLFKKTRKFGTGMLLGIAIGALFTNLFLKIVVARPRPYADESSIYYQLWTIMGRHMESDKSFPSGHTTAAFAAMVPVFLLGKKRYSWTALLFAFAMGLSRIYLVVHYASDVLGGIIVGTIAGIIAVAITKRLPKKWYKLAIFKKKASDADCSDLAS